MQPKERILLKAHELFNRYGIRSVSMDDIAAQTGMSKKTLYLYFTDKDELVSAVFNKVMNDNRSQCVLDQKRADNAVHELFLAFDMVGEMFANMNPAVLFDMEKYHPKVYQTFQDFKNTFLYKMIRSNLEWGVKEELYRPEIDVDVLTRLRIGSIFLAFNPEVFPSNRTQLLHIELQLMEHFVYGLTTVKGQKLIQKYKLQRTKNK
jgi:AcrR family transcriptional regulator